MGSWSEGSEVRLINGETIIGTAYTFKSDKGNLVTVWDSNGILLSWSSVILGVSVEGEINKLPEAPDFGSIDVLPSFGTVQEKEL